MKSGQLWIVQLAEMISSRVYRLVSTWPGFDKRHVGDQLIRAADSINLLTSLFRLSESFTKFIENQRLTPEAKTPNFGDAKHQ